MIDNPIEPLINEDYTTLAIDIDSIFSNHENPNTIQSEFNHKYINHSTFLKEFKLSKDEGLNYSDKEDINKRIRDFHIDNQHKNKANPSYFMYLKETAIDYLFIALIIAEFSLLILRIINEDSQYELMECIVVLLYIVLIIFITSLLNYAKSAKVHSSMKEIRKNKVIVKRNCLINEIEEDELIPGDIMLISKSDVIHVIGVFISGHIVYTYDDNTHEASDSISEFLSIIFPMTTITEGEGSMVVLTTKTYPNPNHNKEIEPVIEDNVKLKINTLANRLRIIGVIVSIIAGVYQIIKIILHLVVYSNPKSSFTLQAASLILHGGISFIILAIVSIPQTFSFVTSIAYTLSMSGMLKENFLIRNISKITTLAQMNYLLIDKSSVLEDNLKVQEAFIFGKKFDKLKTNNSSQIKDDVMLNSTPIIIQKRQNNERKYAKGEESTLVNFLLENEPIHLLNNNICIELPIKSPLFRIPYNTTHNYMLSVYENFNKKSNEKYIAYLRGG